MSKHGLSVDGATNSCIQQLLEVREKVNLMHTEKLPALRVVGSLQPGCDTQDSVPGESCLSSYVDLEVVRVLQQMPELVTLVEYVRNSIPIEDWEEEWHTFRGAIKKLVLRDDMLFYIGDWMVPVVTADLTIEIAVTSHYNMAHMGRDKLVHLLRRHLWHPRLYAVCRDVCTSCPQCQLMKVSRQWVAPPTFRITTAFPFEMVAVDLVQFQKLREGYLGCLVVIDHKSKWLAVAPIKDKQSSTVSFVLEHQILPYLLRVPLRLLSDNGPEFIGRPFEDLLCRYDIKHVLSTPCKPSSNGCAERVNRTLAEMLRSLGEGAGWRGNLTKVVVSYNNTKHRELGISPAEYLLSKQHWVPDCMLASEKDKKHWKAGHPRFAPFVVGQTVMRKIPRMGHAAANKFMQRYEGPFTVIKVNDNGVTYEVQRENRVLKVHHTQLMGWTVPPPYLEERLKVMNQENDEEDEGRGRRDERVPVIVSSEDTSQSDESSSLISCGANDGNEGCRLVRQVPEESICFAHGEQVPSYVCEDSMIFSSPATRGMNPEFYHIGPREESIREDRQSVGLGDQEKEAGASNLSWSQDCGVVLTAQEEVWDVSAIDACEELGEAFLRGDQLEDPGDGRQEEQREPTYYGSSLAVERTGESEMAAGRMMMTATSVSHLGIPETNAGRGMSEDFCGFDDAEGSWRIRKLRNLVHRGSLRRLGNDTTASRRATRLQGPVPELPYVSEYIIERASNVGKTDWAGKPVVVH